MCRSAIVRVRSEMARAVLVCLLVCLVVSVDAGAAKRKLAKMQAADKENRRQFARDQSDMRKEIASLRRESASQAMPDGMQGDAIHTFGEIC